MDRWKQQFFRPHSGEEVRVGSQIDTLSLFLSLPSSLLFSCSGFLVGFARIIRSLAPIYTTQVLVKLSRNHGRYLQVSVCCGIHASSTLDTVCMQVFYSREPINLLLHLDVLFHCISVLLTQGNADSLPMEMCSTFDADEIKRLGKRFRKLDLDNSGSLSIDEFMSLPELQQNPLVQRVIDIFDTDGNGEVDFKEFIQGVSQFSVKGDKESKLKCK